MNKDVLHKFVFGRCTSREKEMVEHWLNESPRNKKVMEELMQIWEVSPGKRIEVDAYKAWDAFNGHYFPHENPQKQADINVRSTNEGTYFQRSRHQKRLKSRRMTAYGAMAAAVVLLAFLLYYVAGFSITDTPPELVNQEIITEKGQRTIVRLSDGTRIYLNAESRLRVAASYNKADSKRIVDLEGEALFEVASDGQRPFEVHTAQSVTRVLGTRFNVNAYPEEEKVEVVVAEGKVVLRSGGKAQSPEVQLTRNQKGTVFSDGKITASKVSDMEKHLDWSRGRLTFRDSSVKEIEQRLERWFDIEVTIAEGITSQNRLLTGSFKDVPLSSVIHSIALSLDMDYRREGRRTVIFEER